MKFKPFLKKYLSPRATTLYGFLICLFMLLAAMYFQFSLGLEPCPLCMVQRVIVLILAILFFIGLCIKVPVWLRLHYVLTFCVAGLGVAAAGRHVWLQHLPAGQAPACGPELQYMLSHFSLEKTFSLLIQGTADCATVQWQFWNLTIAGWTLVFFCILAFIALMNSLRS